MMRQKIVAYLKISRLSNLPTVWSNCLVGTVLAGNGAWLPSLLSALALSFHYVAGMWLNDACDSEIDAVERPMRPIPSGTITRKEAIIASIVLLASANLLLLASGHLAGASLCPIFALGLLLTLCIIAYNWLHKIWPGAVLIMASCRVLIYLTAAQMAGGCNQRVWIAGALLACYIIGLTCLAKWETSPRLIAKWPLFFLFAPCYHLPCPSCVAMVIFAACLVWVSICAVGLITTRLKIPVAVDMLIAGISLWDSLVLSSSGELRFAAFAAVCFLLTLIFHKFIPGT